MRLVVTILALLLPSLGFAAASVQPLTALNTSVMGGERQVYSARFFDALGRPAAGESQRRSMTDDVRLDAGSRRPRPLDRSFPCPL